MYIDRQGQSKQLFSTHKAWHRYLSPGIWAQFAMMQLDGIWNLWVDD